MFRVAPQYLPSQVVTVTAVDVARGAAARPLSAAQLRLTGPMRPADEPLAADVLQHLAGPDPRDPGRRRSGPAPAAHQGHALVALRGLPATPGFRHGLGPARGVHRRPARPPAAPARRSGCRTCTATTSEGSPRACRAHLPEGLDESVHVRPLALDRHGLVLRLYAVGRDHRDTRDSRSAGRCRVGATSARRSTDLLQRAAPHEPGFSC